MLRRLTSSDAEAIADGVGNFDVSKWLAVVPYPYTAEDARSFVAKVADKDKPFWAICNEDGLQGVVCLDDELAYWLARPVWGRGYGFEAAHAAVDYWFADPSAGDLHSGYFESNKRSEALLRALGFRFEERRLRFARSFGQDVVSNRMRLTREQWTARKGFTLITSRLKIRSLRISDASDLTRIVAPEVARHLRDVPSRLTEEAARAYILSSTYRGLPGFRLAIEEDGRTIGVLELGGTPVGIAFFLAPDRWGNGLATEALSAFLRDAFQRFPLTRVMADHFEDNPASGAILRKLGFVRTGQEMGTSKARLEPAPVITYAVTRETLRVPE